VSDSVRGPRSPSSLAMLSVGLLVVIAVRKLHLMPR
jgi:hypothetical protein